MRSLRPIARVLDAVDGALFSVGNVALMAIMLIVVVDVGMRYVFNAPLIWSYDVISLYLMIMVFYFGVARTLKTGHHVNVDIVSRRLPFRVLLASRLITWAAVLLVFALIAEKASVKAVSSYASGEVIAGAIPWPIWLQSSIVAIGSFAMCLRLLLAMVDDLLALFGNVRGSQDHGPGLGLGSREG